MFIVANWKMNGKFSDIQQFTNIVDYIKEKNTVKLVLCLPTTLLYYASIKLTQINNKNSFLGAQDSHWQESGAYTGDISAKMVYECGARYVILGHSERRKYHCESNAIIAKKVQIALNENLKTIICVGENLNEKANATEIIKSQLKEILVDISENKIKEGYITIAYEPIWAIGTGKIPLNSEIEKVFKTIKNLLKDMYGTFLTRNIKIIYGGSVNKENAQELINISDLNGLLIGGASLKIETFMPLINIV